MITWSRQSGNLTRLVLWVTRLEWQKGEQKTKWRGLQLKVGPQTPRQISRKIYMSLRLTEGFCNSAVSLTSSTIRCDETWTRMTKVSHNRLHCQRLFISKALGSRESVFVFIKKSVRQIKLTNDDQWPDQTHLVQLLRKVSKTEQVARILQTVDSRQYLDRESLKTWLAGIRWRSATTATISHHKWASEETHRNSH